MSEVLNFSGIKRLSAPPTPPVPPKPTVKGAVEPPSRPKVLDEVTVSTASTQPTHEEVEDTFNPVLDDDDDETYTPQPAAEEPPSKAPSKREPKRSSKPVDDSTDGVSKSYRRSRITETDREVIEFLYE